MAQNAPPPSSILDGSVDLSREGLHLYDKQIDVRWADCDANGHLRHSAYADYGTHVRFSYLAERGYTADRFAEEGIAPALLLEQVRFLREVLHHERVTVDFNVETLSEDGARWRVFHNVKLKTGKRAAIVTAEGAFMDIKTRKLRSAPDDLRKLMADLPVKKIPTYRLLKF